MAEEEKEGKACKVKVEIGSDGEPQVSLEGNCKPEEEQLIDALKEKGITPICARSGFILRTGEFIDLGNPKDKDDPFRCQDHHIVAEEITHKVLQTIINSPLRYLMQKTGVIRLHVRPEWKGNPELDAEFETDPTNEQIEAIANCACQEKAHEVTVERSLTEGPVIWRLNATVPNGRECEVIKRDIIRAVNRLRIQFQRDVEIAKLKK